MSSLWIVGTTSSILAKQLSVDAANGCPCCACTPDTQPACPCTLHTDVGADPHVSHAQSRTDHIAPVRMKPNDPATSALRVDPLVAVAYPADAATAIDIDNEPSWTPAMPA